MYLFFDTETTGLPKDYKAPVSAVNNWPRLVQLGFILADQDGNRINHASLIIKPDGFVIPEESIKTHGITTEQALVVGVSLKATLYLLTRMASYADVIVAHNFDFDIKIVGAEFYRTEVVNKLVGKKSFCTMKNKAIIDFCHLPGKWGGAYKWPSLQDLHNEVFNHEFIGAHDAFADVTATAACFFELKKKGILK